MLHHIWLTLVALVVLSVPLAVSAAESFTVLTAPYPPFSVSKGLKVEGLSVTALTKLMEMCDVPIDQSDIKLAPWAYGYECTARESKCILLNAQRTPQTESLYKWVGPVISSKVVLVGRKKDQLFIPTKAQLKNYRIATVRWSRTEKALIANGMAPDDLIRGPVHVEGLRKLRCGEVDLFATNQRGVDKMMEGLGMKSEDYTIYYTVDENPLYFAFSQDTDDRFINRLNAKLKDLKATGKHGENQFDQILKAQLQ